MASGVFGTPITVETVAATGLYPEPITQRDCADYAAKMINAGGKDDDALQFVDNLKEEYGNGISAKCLIYNQTGTDLNLVTSRDFYGYVFESPYPHTLQNGQWGAFLHVHSGLTGSAGAVVYRTFLPDVENQWCDWAYSWSIPYVGDNRAYTIIRDNGYFNKGGDFWDQFYTTLDNAGRSSSDNNYGYLSSLEIGESTTSIVRGLFKI